MFKRSVSRVIGALVLLFAAEVAAKNDQPAADLSARELALRHGSILVYHHVSSQTPPSTSISPERFAEHLAHLAENHQVIPLADMIGALKQGNTVPEKAVAITFDDGYESIYRNGHPLLKQYGFPYTVFVNPPRIGKQRDQLTWEQMAEMGKDGATFANHTSDHLHLLTRLDGESEQAWLSRTLEDINRAESLLTDKVGYSLKYLAYPFGEFNLALKNAIEAQGYTGFGQHSGAVAAYSDFGAVPRFAAAGIYANLNTLKVKLNSLAMPVVRVSQSNPQLSHSQRQPEQRLTIDTADLNPARINCFVNGSPMAFERDKATLSLKPSEPLGIGRSRINCTVPSNSLKGRFYWFSQPWFIPASDGRWPN